MEIEKTADISKDNLTSKRTKLITEENINKGVEKLKNRKRAGPDGIQSDQIKYKLKQN